MHFSLNYFVQDFLALKNLEEFDLVDSLRLRQTQDSQR